MAASRFSSPAGGLCRVGEEVVAANPDGPAHMHSSWLWGCRTVGAAEARARAYHKNDPRLCEIYELEVDEADLDPQHDVWWSAGAAEYIRFKRCKVVGVVNWNPTP